ncbi:MAG TPA: 3-methyl-2-oxobutanoate hydroxymethyltransferase [Gammaproteobacteria bacterium]|nr:3-methyl-2-oxobutanoate hydroxymethyltransferase [Gammaproteobacteria bacterium]
MNMHDFQKMKNNHQKITMVTCYDHWSAQIIAKSQIDSILVGDSVAMVMYGHANTLPATVNIMANHIEAVVKGAPNKFIIGDLPFCSYRKGLVESMNAVEKFAHAGAQAIKLEGAAGNLELIEHIVTSGIPVMGHLGLTLQSIHSLGGFKVQGKNQKAAEKIMLQAKQLQDAGCFSVVLECMPSTLAKDITDALTIPTIGIGAGPHTSGQILVLQDMLGMNCNFKPKFLKHYLNGTELIQNALNQYNQEVKSNVFPNIEEHCYADS